MAPGALKSFSQAESKPTLFERQGRKIRLYRRRFSLRLRRRTAPGEGGFAITKSSGLVACPGGIEISA
jgi:hypothetical protein